MPARLQIRLEAGGAHRAAVESSDGLILMFRRLEFRMYGEQLCAVITLDHNGFELCTIHGRKCHLPDPEWIAVSNAEAPKGYCRVLVAIPDLRFLSSADFRLSVDKDDDRKEIVSDLHVCHFELRRESEKKLEFELDLWVAPQSYWLDFMNG
jgi:hypothetical protein